MITKRYWGFVLVLLCSVYLASCCEPRFVSINPDEVQQGDTDVQMVLTTKWTFFQDAVFDTIFFSPEGITVHDIIVEDNTTLSFMIDVAEDAELGHYTLTATWDNANQFIIGVHVLEVHE